MLSFYSSLDFWSGPFRVYHQNTAHIYLLSYAYYKGYPEIKDTQWVGEEGKYRLKVAAHCPDRYPSDFHFFLHLKKHLVSQKFHEDEEVKNEVTKWLHAQAVEFYGIGIQKLVPRLNKCLDRCGDYVKK